MDDSCYLPLLSFLLLVSANCVDARKGVGPVASGLRVFLHATTGGLGGTY